MHLGQLKYFWLQKILYAKCILVSLGSLNIFGFKKILYTKRNLGSLNIFGFKNIIHQVHLAEPGGQAGNLALANEVVGHSGQAGQVG